MRLGLCRSVVGFFFTMTALCAIVAPLQALVRVIILRLVTNGIQPENNQRN